MKRIKILKSYFIFWLFIFFLVSSNIEQIKMYFFATLTFNIAIMAVLGVGVVMLMRASFTLIMLAGTFGTLAHKKDNLMFYLQGIDKFMPANIAQMFYSRAEKGILLFTAKESRAVIDWIEEKFASQNKFNNFFASTALMIGLLGTFAGLLIAIDDMGKIILSIGGDIEIAKVMADFSGPLGGMATGFGSSLFGVVTAIILGVKGYILNKNQGYLIEGIEDWLKGRIVDTHPDFEQNNTHVSTNTTEANLPNRQKNFIDIFIDHLSSITQEMKDIAVSNQKLHSVTMKSLDRNYEIFKEERKFFDIIAEALQNMNKKEDVLITEISGVNYALNHEKELLKNILQSQENLNVKESELFNMIKNKLENIYETENNLLLNINKMDNSLDEEKSLIQKSLMLQKLSAENVDKKLTYIIQMEDNLIKTYENSSNILNNSISNLANKYYESAQLIADTQREGYDKLNKNLNISKEQSIYNLNNLEKELEETKNLSEKNLKLSAVNLKNSNQILKLSKENAENKMTTLSEHLDALKKDIQNEKV